MGAVKFIVLRRRTVACVRLTQLTSPCRDDIERRRLALEHAEEEANQQLAKAQQVRLRETRMALPRHKYFCFR